MRGNTSRGRGSGRVTWVRIQVNGHATVRSKTKIDMQIVCLIARSGDRDDVFGVAELTENKFARIRGYHLFEQVPSWISEVNRSLLDRTFRGLGINRSSEAERLLGKEILRDCENRSQRENCDVNPGHSHPNSVNRGQYITAEEEEKTPVVRV